MYKAVVVGTDGSGPSKRAVLHAVGLARATGATLHLVHAYRLPSQMPPMAPEVAAFTAGADTDVIAAANELLDDAARVARDEGIGEVQVHACTGPAADALCRVAAEEGADVIVVGNKGMKGARRVLGSVPNSVAHRADCAVLVVPTA